MFLTLPLDLKSKALLYAFLYLILLLGFEPKSSKPFIPYFIWPSFLVFCHLVLTSNRLPTYLVFFASFISIVTLSLCLDPLYNVPNGKKNRSIALRIELNAMAVLSIIICILQVRTIRTYTIEGHLSPGKIEILTHHRRPTFEKGRYDPHPQFNQAVTKSVRFNETRCYTGHVFRGV